jgi:hypothetical protein
MVFQELPTQMLALRIFDLEDMAPAMRCLQDIIDGVEDWEIYAKDYYNDENKLAKA